MTFKKDIRKPKGSVSKSAQGIEGFNEVALECECLIESIICEVGSSVNKDGFLIKVDYSGLIKEFNKLIETARNDIERGVLMPGLHVKKPD